MIKKFINRTISILYRYNQRFFALKMAEYSLPIEVGQIPSLIQVYLYPGITQDGISSNVGLDKGTVARILKQLEDGGLIIRVVDQKDRRVNHIYATPQGLKIKDKVFQVIRELHETLYQGFSDEEIEEAISLLERMKSNIGSYIKKYEP